GAAQRALAPRRHALASLMAIAVVLAVGALPIFGGQSLLRARPSIALGEQAARLYLSWAVMSGHDQRYAGALAAPQPPAGLLPGLKRQDVYLVFFESYGTTVLDTPRYAATVKPALAEFAATVGRAGYHLASSRIVSPTFGGGSWLAHGTVASGVKLDLLLARLVATSGRLTLPRYMSAAGYRTVEVMPGLKTPAPEDAFWGYDESYRAGDLGYDGPPFGWFGIPDQYTLAHLDATEGAPGHAPLFAQIVLVSSHTPFAPVPPYVAAADQAGVYQGYRGIAQSTWDNIYAPPDWSHLDKPYVASVVYDLKALGNWLAQRPGDGLVIIMGDHQPPGFIAGDKQPWTVPIHVLSRAADLLRPFLAAGYVAGALPPSAGPFKGMETFLGDFLAAYSRPPATVAERRGPPEHVSD
ncbi:MAG TPA: sulfatase-like hydrolase/transferase, partial [Stellaceae bacterium]|nr:sulfatase-like hydrolase/transferase [Stellaceae bacterium]